MFGKLIVGICEAVKPAYTLIDAILAMEGQGPGKRGIPRHLGVLIAGNNPHAVDHAACIQVGVDPNELETQRSARKMKIYDGCLEIDGKIDSVTDFYLPKLGSLSMGPQTLNRFMRKFVIQQPAVDGKACKLCGECWNICPASAISHTRKGISFNTHTCIRCYCCLEVCPHAAICAKKPLTGKVVEWLSPYCKRS
jgi:Pyruvate/2-oxoacid:ferredoxin oxidoreductase delta subunit